MIGKQNGAPRQGWRGSLTFTNPYNGTTTELRFCSALVRDEGWGFVDLEHDGRDREGGRQSYRVRLRSTPQPFGGQRWWFVCPMTGRKTVKLYLPRGAAQFASREAFGLAYQCTRETPRDRAYRRAWKRREAMGGKPGVPLDTPMDKPPRRHWDTWDRDEAKMAADVAVCNRYLILSALRLGALQARLAG